MKFERFEGLKARDQKRQQGFTKPPETLKPSHTPERLSLERAADGEIELRAGEGQDDNRLYVQGDPYRYTDGEKEMLRYVELQGELSKSDVRCDPEESTNSDKETVQCEEKISEKVAYIRLRLTDIQCDLK